MKRIRISHYGYLLPMFILVLAVTLYPFVDAIGLGFYNKNLLYPARDHFVGLENFIKLITRDPLFMQSLKHSAVFTIGSVLFEYLVGLGSALLLSSKYAPAKNLLKALVLLPWAVPIAVNSIVWKFLLLPRTGFIGQFLALMGFSNMPDVNWLGSLHLVMGVVVFVNVWRSFPFFTIVLTAGLVTISKELYESAEVDGASKLQRFWHITMPGIRHVTLVIVVFHLIWTFINFDVIYLLTGGGPLHATEVLPTLLYRDAFTYFNMGYASSIGVLILVILSVTVGPFYSRVNR